MVKIRVDISKEQRSYPIIIAEGIRERFAGLLTEYYQGDKILLVTDENVAALYAGEMVQGLEKSGFRVELYQLPPGENSKGVESLYSGYDLLVKKGFNRDNLIAALGGGVVGDLAGFLAATYMRGIPFVQIPTTLLAQVDSSVGGKTAVNHRAGKNLIGAFYQPELVVIDPTFLTTLPGREMRTGMAEVIKSGLIANRDFTGFLRDNYAELKALKMAEMVRIISTSCKIKASIVRDDERETGKRALLNYGHTIGHALETVTHYNRYTHGEAVALGMIGAGELAVKMGLMEQESQQAIIELIRLFGLPTAARGVDPELVYRALFRDKKVRDNRLRWILLRGIGDPVIRDDLDARLIKAVLEGLCRDENCSDSRA